MLNYYDMVGHQSPAMRGRVFGEEINISYGGCKREESRVGATNSVIMRPSFREYTILVRLFRPMAHHIVSYHNPPIEIPQSFYFLCNVLSVQEPSVAYNSGYEVKAWRRRMTNTRTL